MNAIIISLLNIAIPAGVAFITTLLTLRFSKRHSQEQDYDMAMEVLQNLYIDAEMHITDEINEWWINMEHGDAKGPKLSKYIYPIAKMKMLAQRYEPGLNKDIEQMEGVIHILRGNNDPDSWVPEKEYYYLEIQHIEFSKIRESFEKKFEIINQQHYQKKGVKSLLTTNLNTDHTTV